MYIMSGWPGRLFKLLLSPAIAKATLDEFRKDYETWESMRSLHPVPTGLSPVLERSLFKLTAVKQLVAAFSETDWETHPDIELLLRERGYAIIGTQLVEDIFGVQKNSKQVRGSKKFRKCENSITSVRSWPNRSCHRSSNARKLS